MGVDEMTHKRLKVSYCTAYGDDGNRWDDARTMGWMVGHMLGVGLPFDFYG